MSDEEKSERKSKISVKYDEHISEDEPKRKSKLISNDKKPKRKSKVSTEYDEYESEDDVPKRKSKVSSEYNDFISDDEKSRRKSKVTTRYNDFKINSEKRELHRTKFRERDEGISRESFGKIKLPRSNAEERGRLNYRNFDSRSSFATKKQSSAKSEERDSYQFSKISSNSWERSGGSNLNYRDVSVKMIVEPILMIDLNELFKTQLIFLLIYKLF
ncbi:8864_t:CDS:2 [Ambispora leptoticha]|uniref:8864_t:CDS:1 n=1 Tax=Ambispora leptoticha TaxID=144679 RepID=A0A9N8WHZ7_9GLOM|nr:8864_t:CDS:2 [Ambispora leptoticha]